MPISKFVFPIQYVSKTFSPLCCAFFQKRQCKSDSNFVSLFQNLNFVKIEKCYFNCHTFDLSPLFHTFPKQTVYHKPCAFQDHCYISKKRKEQIGVPAVAHQ